MTFYAAKEVTSQCYLLLNFSNLLYTKELMQNTSATVLRCTLICNEKTFKVERGMKYVITEMHFPIVPIVLCV